MKHIIHLTVSGGTLGFTIPDHILDALNINLKEPVEIEIFKEYKKESSFIITPKVRIIGGSKGVSIRYYLVNELGLKAKETYQADIRKPSQREE